MHRFHDIGSVMMNQAFQFTSTQKIAPLILSYQNPIDPTAGSYLPPAGSKSILRFSKDFQTYSSFLCLLHVHDKEWGKIDKLFRNCEWEEPVDCDRNYQTRYCLEQVHRNNNW